MSYKSIVLERKPGAECVRHHDGSWHVYDPVSHIGSGKSPAAAWNNAAVTIARIAQQQKGDDGG